MLAWATKASAAVSSGPGSWQVQHRGLRETSVGDVDAVSFVVAVVDRMFPKFSYKWLADEMERNLPDELNFLHEAENGRK